MKSSFSSSSLTIAAETTTMLSAWTHTARNICKSVEDYKASSTSRAPSKFMSYLNDDSGMSALCQASYICLGHDRTICKLDGHLFRTMTKKIVVSFGISGFD